MLKIATAQYGLLNHASLNEFKLNAENWVREASSQQAKILIFPEYGSIELVSLLDKDIQKNLKLQLREIQQFRDEFLTCYQTLAKKYNVYIVTPSFPWLHEKEHFTNRAFLINPEGHCDFQDKQMMTRFEDEQWKVSSPLTKELKVFDVEGIKFGISICFDIEFPDFSRELALAGVQVIVAPSCTETAAGMNRVHVGARARALENQLYVVVSQTVGMVDYSEAIDNNTGVAAIYSTCDKGFPDDGIIVKGPLNISQWVYGEIDVALIYSVREHGSVLNFKKIASTSFGR